MLRVRVCIVFFFLPLATFLQLLEISRNFRGELFISQLWSFRAILGYLVTTLMKLTFILPDIRRILNMFSFELHTSPIRGSYMPFFHSKKPPECKWIMKGTKLIQSKVPFSSKVHLFPNYFNGEEKKLSTYVI